VGGGDNLRGAHECSFQDDRVISMCCMSLLQALKQGYEILRNGHSGSPIPG
jgi:hypothetical protein